MMKQHHIFLLHVWTQDEEEEHERTLVWAALEEPHSRNRWGFTDLESLVRFLMRRVLNAEAQAPERVSGERDARG